MKDKIRLILEETERSVLSSKATLSAETSGRERPEGECDIRTAFQADRDRILHSKSFRRLKHKTQVFLSPSGDHYRTRLTHTFEVSQIARTASKALRLNEDLTEAISMGHDLGHTPFGHSGEEVLNEIHPGGFKHAEQSLRIVDVLERGGKGLNLTHEVREGIRHHSKGLGPLLGPSGSGRRPLTLEAQIVRIADSIAYVNHDLDDALRAGIISPTDPPDEVLRILGHTHSMRIDTMVKDLIFNSLELELESIGMSPQILEATEQLRAFLYRRAYIDERVHGEFLKASKIIREFYHYFNTQPVFLPSGKEASEEFRQRRACDHIAGMSDRYALELYNKLFLPEPWKGMG